MKLYAISDLHLPGGQQKPMDIFGDGWKEHFEKIRACWLGTVGEDDAVLLPGDLSWAMTLEEALPDINALAALPGEKVILRGNHDYWWPTAKKLREALPRGVHALQNDSILLGDCAVWGSRGWINPDSQQFAHDDEKIYRREVMRLQMSLDDAKKRFPGSRSIAMMHYPPFASGGKRTPMTDIISEAGAECCIYGHIHNAGSGELFNGVIGGVRYICVSCDMVGFRLVSL